MTTAVLLLAALGSLRGSDGTPKLILDANEKVYRPGQKMMLRFTVENDSEAEAKIDEPENYLEGLEIRDPEGRVVKATGKTKGITRRSPQVEAHGFIGRAVDVSSVLPVAEDKEGVYRVRWSFGDATSNEVRMLVMRDWIAELETNYGKISIEFRPDLAPNHVLNFLRLTRSGFYEATTFHRIIPGFMMQGGGPPPGKAETATLKAEFSSVRHLFGTVSAARTDNPDSASSQFFICFGPAPHLDHAYTVFGQVVKGDDVVKDVEKVKSDHSPCKCGQRNDRPGATPCCGRHHQDKPESDVILKKVTLIERKK